MYELPVRKAALRAEGEHVGVLRLMLAICVVFGHVSYTSLFTGPVAAVEAFYIISGFYIALVLDTTAAYRKAWAFYTNRYLRLYPVYFVTAIAALAFRAIAEPALLREILSLPLLGEALVIFSNLTLLGQDWVMFVGVDHGHLQLAHTVHSAMPYPLWHFLLLSPAWSLGCELTFYLLAPFLVRLRDRWLWLVIACSLAARALGIRLGYSQDPWSYRFFPFELGVFCLGITSYRIYKQWRKRPEFQQDKYAWTGIGIFFVYTILFSVIALPGRRPIYLLCVCAVLPWLFHRTRSSRWDRAIGELSYPVYITHQLVVDIWRATPFCMRLVPDGVMLSLMVCALAILFGLLLNRFVQEPFERLRLRTKSEAVKVEIRERQHGAPVVAE